MPVPVPLATAKTDTLPLDMTVTIDISPKYNLHEIRNLVRQSQQKSSPTRSSPNVTHLKPLPVSSRLGPPVPRLIPSPANDHPVIHSDTSPLPTGLNPEQ